MKFWGVEVKSGEPLSVNPGDQNIVHILLAALGQKKNSGNKPARLYLKVGDKKLVIGTLSHDKFPQLSTKIVLERHFTLSHNWKDGSVFFSGYKVGASHTDDDDDEPAAADHPIYSQYIVSQDDSNDLRYEPLLHPRRIILKNLHRKTTKADIRSFFKDKASVTQVTFNKPERSCLVELENLAETRNALQLNGERLRIQVRPESLGDHVYIVRWRVRRVLFVSNFETGLEKEVTKVVLQEILGKQATIVGIFLPDDLDFGYILVKKWNAKFEKSLEQGSIKKGNKEIFVREAFMVPEFMANLN